MFLATSLQQAMKLKMQILAFLSAALLPMIPINGSAPSPRTQTIGAHYLTITPRILSTEEYAATVGANLEELGPLPGGLSIVALDMGSLPLREKFLLCYENLSGIGPTFIQEFKSDERGNPLFDQNKRVFISFVKTIRGEPLRWLVFRKNDHRCIGSTQLVPRPIRVEGKSGASLSLILESADAIKFRALLEGVPANAILNAAVKSDNQIRHHSIKTDNHGLGKLSFSPAYKDYLGGEAVFLLSLPESDESLEIKFEWGKKALHF